MLRKKKKEKGKFKNHKPNNRSKSSSVIGLKISVSSNEKKRTKKNPITEVIIAVLLV